MFLNLCWKEIFRQDKIDVCDIKVKNSILKDNPRLSFSLTFIYIQMNYYIRTYFQSLKLTRKT
jgi:hypothetical protein